MTGTDTVYEVETPEGIMLHMRVAGLPARAMAYGIDFLIRIVVYIVASMIMGLALGRASAGIFLIFMFVVEWFYPVYFEVFRKGQTPGKRSMKIKVLNGDGTPIGWQPSMIRNFLLIADMMPLFYGFGIMASFFDSRSRRLGDMAADTIVVYEKEITKGSMPEGKGVAPPVPLTIEEQKAVVSFGERHTMLSQPRQEELAAILVDLHGEKKKKKAVKTIQSYAISLAGGGKK